jgi:hypothetical protein
LRDAIGGHVDISRQFSRAHIECLQFFGQVLTRMDSSDCDSDSLLMIVNNLNVRWRPRTRYPLGSTF